MPLPSSQESKPIEYPCAICGAPSSGCVWDTDLCHEHYGAWHADPRFESGSVDAAIGMKKVKGAVLEFYPPHTPAQAAASAAEYRKRVAAWLVEQRATGKSMRNGQQASKDGPNSREIGSAKAGVAA